jgi:hypothetical protein
MNIWVYEPGHDDWAEGVYLTLDAAIRDLKLEDHVLQTDPETGLRYVEMGTGILGEFEVIE